VDIGPLEMDVETGESEAEARLSVAKEQCRIALHAQEARTLTRMWEVFAIAKEV
jgi:hypothetical protein